VAFVLALVIFALLAGGLVLCAPRICYRIFIRRPARPPVRRGGGASWLDTRPVEDAGIVSHDGLKLRAWYSAAGNKPSGGDTAIFAHGYLADGRQLGEYARIFLEKLGCHVLLPDARGCGRSEGDYIGFGWHERLDMLGWINWVKARHAAANSAAGGSPAPVRIALFGLSMGAATMLMVSGENPPPEVKLVIEDCGYTSLDEEMRYQLQYLYHLPWTIRERLLEAASAITEKRAGYRFEEVSALGQVKKSKTPTLFIHGGADTYVPTGMVYPLFEACTAEKELYIVPGASHTAAFTADTLEYEKRITRFVRKYMPALQESL
jgi:fermentation-respiration switch protein FrsA (DUF1100 family)